jgi:hypothetical protein
MFFDNQFDRIVKIKNPIFRKKKKTNFTGSTPLKLGPSITGVNLVRGAVTLVSSSLQALIRL